MAIEHAPEIIEAIKHLAAFSESMNLSGLVILFLLGPGLVLATLIYVDFLRLRQGRKESERQRAEILEILDQYRTDTNKFQTEFSAKHDEVVQFYKDNVELVKTTQRLALDMRDIIVNNTRAMESLTSAVKSNFFCPVARESATGSK